MATHPRLPLQMFARLLIAALVVEGRRSFCAHESADREALMRLHAYVAGLVDLKGEPLPDDLLDLIRIRNVLAPSYTGAFDAFESLLRDQQHWLTSSRNPTFEVISFDVPPEIGNQLLSEASDSVAEIAKAAAAAFSNHAP
jgi:hypothetical protein